MYRTGVYLTGTESAMCREAIRRAGYTDGKDIVPESLQHMIMAFALLHGLPDDMYSIIENELYCNHQILNEDTTPAQNAAEFAATMKSLMELKAPAQKRSLWSRLWRVKG